MGRLGVIALVSLMLFRSEDLPQLARLVRRAAAVLHRIVADLTEIVHDLEVMDAEEAAPPHHG